MILEWIEGLRKFLNVLSWTKVIQAFLVAMVLVGSLIAWEGRGIFYRFFQVNQMTQTITLSKKSISEIESFTRTSEIVIGTQITSVDLQKNTRKVLFAAVDDDRIRKLYDRYLEDIKITEFPLFKNDDQVNNTRIINLLNGHFVCNPYPESLAGHVMPEGAVVISTVCAIGIPPEYGKFVGIVTLYLKRPPTAEEHEILLSLTRDLALHIYKNDIE
jgi:hypothetical protein